MQEITSFRTGDFSCGMIVGTINFSLYAMEPTSFLPKLPSKADTISRTLMMIARGSLLLGVILVPVSFVPGAPALLGASKVFVVLVTVLVALVCMSLAILRSGAVSLRVVPLVFAWWGVVLASFVSALLSPTLLSSLFGDILEIHTVAFLALLGCVMTMIPMVGMTKRSVVYLYGAGILVAVFVVVFHIARVLFGATVLTFGQFGNPSMTPVGSFNDMGLFFGLVVLLSLVAVVQLSLSRKILALTAALVVSALGLLMIVNFYAIWVVLALFSLLMLMYTLTKDRFGVTEETHHQTRTKTSVGGVGIIGIVFTVATVFLIGGSNLGNVVVKATGVNYLEVRPSVTATIGIVRSVYSEHMLTGTGPNRFTEAWSQYKDPTISQTIFWDTSFNAGNGYIPTWFVTTGVIGLLAWLVFLLCYFYTGITMLVRAHAADEFWYFAGTTAFVSGAFVWLMACMYVPGPAILIIGAACTGMMLVAERAIIPKRTAVYNMLTTARTGFVLIAVVMIVIIGIIAVGYAAVRQVSAAYIFVTAASSVSAGATDPGAEIINNISKAFTTYPTDTYAREAALYHMRSLNTLLGLESATPAEQDLFQRTVTAGVTAASEAVRIKPTDARNYRVLGDLYAVLAVINIEGARARADESYASAEKLDPQNPYYVLQKSAMSYRAKDLNGARSLALLSLALKPNYTEALALLAQVDIADGNVAQAIETTKSIIQLDSNNPGRYYFLGLLYSANKNSDAAINAFTAAVTLEPQYANALYMRALEYLRKGDTAKAKSDLAQVRDMNPDNTSIGDLITKVDRGEITADTLKGGQTVNEAPATATNEGEVTTTDKAPDTDLLTPVNTAAAPKVKKTEGKTASTTTVTE